MVSLEIARRGDMLNTLRGVVVVASVADLESVGAGGKRVLVFVTDSRRDTVKLQADARSAGPSVRGRGITFDLAAAASLAGAHH